MAASIIGWKAGFTELILSFRGNWLALQAQHQFKLMSFRLEKKPKKVLEEKVTNLEFWGPTLLRSYEELAVMAESGMRPECIPRPSRQCAERKRGNEQSAMNSDRHMLGQKHFFLFLLVLFDLSFTQSQLAPPKSGQAGHPCPCAVSFLLSPHPHKHSLKSKAAIKNRKYDRILNIHSLEQAEK